eukprot:781226-Pleurochrysis_carterae.AAC.2
MRCERGRSLLRHAVCGEEHLPRGIKVGGQLRPAAENIISRAAGAIASVQQAQGRRGPAWREAGWRCEVAAAVADARRMCVRSRGCLKQRQALKQAVKQSRGRRRYIRGCLQLLRAGAQESRPGGRCKSG